MLRLSTVCMLSIIQGARNDRDSVLAQTAAAEALSEYPPGRAIVQAARARGLSRQVPAVAGFQATPGMGISCNLVGGGKGKKKSTGTEGESTAG